MLVELIGLPGSGKSTIIRAATPLLKAAGLRFDSMRMVSKKFMAEDRPNVRFLTKRAERSSLYGCFSFAEDQQDLFRSLLDGALGDVSQTLWNMEMLGQFQFLRNRDLSDTMVFLDEGFLHRGVSTFAASGELRKLIDYMDLVTHDFITIHITTPLDMALARAEMRRRGVPENLQASTGIGLSGMEAFDQMIKVAVAHRKLQGAAVIEVDATQPAAIAARQMVDALARLAPVSVQRPLKGPRLRRRKARATGAPLLRVVA